MKRSCALLVAALTCIGFPSAAAAQMNHPGTMSDMKHEAAAPSTVLVLTGLDGTTRTLSPADLKAMQHATVAVTNGHSGARESYTGVPVSALLLLVNPAKDDGRPAAPTRTTVVLAEGTDHYQVAITLCDTNPACRSGEAIVADALDGTPLTKDGAFKLILTEDRMPSRWVRNLDALTIKNVGSQ